MESLQMIRQVACIATCLIFFSAVPAFFSITDVGGITM
ncbi:unnamed protein product [Acanthoscelides obtectus]|uniref:Uncharacterized protein n=1 Tax=Acanthoscelides obtectus TaxID=200917 RepID=A0A9P0L5B4_ACAOB|nr:unnamed protein product [Acanthoscelides obtectus]CAH2016397.1 unnamed protein product [Acanthoscelides obtectus]CAK1674549.1 hypothetical protein AOBTE_LOCUS29654 [Acanthoscelides obtectus]CAK1674699.1 hypothetical protein AOBTE_LOCUS29711 [Acanthoscelides obtectus]